MPSEPEPRKAFTPPLACFGLEYRLTDPACTDCPHFSACGKITGQQRRHVPLDQAVFSLRGPTTAGPTGATPDAASLYQLIHEQVFQRRARETLPADLAQAATEAAQRLRVSLEVYFYACLLGHQVSCPERAFRATYLTNDTADKRVRFYRDKAKARFHALDLPSIARLSPSAAAPQQGAMFDSELLFGTWIVNERCRRGGNGVAALYARRERALAPEWLATEPSYARWRETQPTAPYLNTNRRRITDDDSIAEGAPVFNEIGRHRHAVSQIAPTTYRALLRRRSEVLPAAAAHVLHTHGVAPNRLAAASPITDAFQFWLHVGDALLQLRLFQLVHG